MSALLAFSVTAENAEAGVLLFAKDRSDAKAIARSSEWLNDVEWIDLRVKREPKADYAAEQFGRGYLELNDMDGQRLVRNLFWFEIDHSHEECRVCKRFEWSRVPESKLSEDGEFHYICVECKINREKQPCGTTKSLT